MMADDADMATPTPQSEDEEQEIDLTGADVQTGPEAEKVPDCGTGLDKERRRRMMKAAEDAVSIFGLFLLLHSSLNSISV